MFVTCGSRLFVNLFGSSILEYNCFAILLFYIVFQYCVIQYCVLLMFFCIAFLHCFSIFTIVDFFFINFFSSLILFIIAFLDCIPSLFLFFFFYCLATTTTSSHSPIFTLAEDLLLVTKCFSNYMHSLRLYVCLFFFASVGSRPN